MAAPRPFRHTPDTLRGAIRTSKGSPSNRVRAAAPCLISAHSSHASWPHRELQGRPQRQGPHCDPHLIRHLNSHIDSSGPSMASSRKMGVAH
eukprot:6127980-Pyramimonas_sp.AAC.1